MPIDTTYLDADSDNVMLARPALLETAQAVNTLSTSGGSALVGWLRSAIGAAATTLSKWLGWQPVSLVEFLTDAEIADIESGTAAIDVTAKVQAYFDHLMLKGCKGIAPPGRIKLTAAIVINKGVDFEGSGVVATVFNLVSPTVTRAFVFGPNVNGTNIIGSSFGGFGVVCNGGAAVCDGIDFVTAASASALTHCVFHDIRIYNARRGCTLDGVIYMNHFRDITVSIRDGGTIAEKGWYADSTHEVIYNTFTNLEVTGVGNSAYAYYLNTSASQFKNITADGCCYFAGAYTSVKGFAIEGISAAVTPSTTALQLNQIQSIEDVAMINIPNAKCNVGINAIATNMRIDGVKFPDSGAGNQPNTPVLWQAGNTGTLTNVRMDRACVTKLESAMAESILAGFVIESCATITGRGLSYSEGVWTPGFATWSTAPSVSSARYIKVGRMVTLVVNFNGGVCADFSTITGLPFVADAAVGGVAHMASGSLTQKFTSTIAAGGSSISNIPALTLTGPIYGQMSATYLAA